MKKSISILCILVLLMGLLTGCGGGEDTAQPAGDTSGDYLLRIATASAETQPYTAVLYDLEKTVEEQTEGHVQVEIYPAAQLGGEEDMLRKTMTGTIESCITSVASIASYKSDLYLLYTPFMYSTIDAVKTVAGSDMLVELMGCINDLGLTHVGITTSGGTTFATKDELKSLDDFKGLKLRSPSLEVYLNVYNAIGVSPTPIPYAEVFTALQQGTVDGFENSLTTIATGNYHEAGVKHVWATNQIFGWMDYVVNTEWLESLPDEYKTIVLDAFAAAADGSLQSTWDMDMEVAESGVYNVHFPTDEELAQLQAMTVSVTDGYVADLKETVGVDFLKEWFEMTNYAYEF
ncbi:MAG: TRAP transporter substrate-binding protein [Firmicutes bacterium]|nr:TRAP transporter substrate-binding protein [Bacillota bacterium]